MRKIIISNIDMMTDEEEKELKAFLNFSRIKYSESK